MYDSGQYEITISMTHNDLPRNVSAIDVGIKILVKCYDESEDSDYLDKYDEIIRTFTVENNLSVSMRLKLCEDEKLNQILVDLFVKDIYDGKIKIDQQKWSDYDVFVN